MQNPLSLLDASVWLAITAIILLITAEVTSPYYGEINLLVNKKRLRRASLTMGMLFLVTIAIFIYQLMTTT